MHFHCHISLTSSPVQYIIIFCLDRVAHTSNVFFPDGWTFQKVAEINQAMMPPLWPHQRPPMLEHVDAHEVIIAGMIMTKYSLTDTPKTLLARYPQNNTRHEPPASTISKPIKRYKLNSWYNRQSWISTSLATTWLAVIMTDPKNMWMFFT